MFCFEAKITKVKRSENRSKSKNLKQRPGALPLLQPVVDVTIPACTTSGINQTNSQQLGTRQKAKKTKKSDKKQKKQKNRLEFRFALFRFKAKITKVKRSEKFEEKISEKKRKKRSEIL